MQAERSIAVTSRSGDNLDLFTVGADGVVYTTWWYAGSDWGAVTGDWRPIGGFFPPGAPVTAIAKSPTSIDLFVVGNDGRVYTSWWYEGSDWSGINDNWRSIGGFFPPGARVSATSRNAGNLDLFITGNDGRVYTSWWYAGSDWSGINDNWRGIGGFFPPGAPVTAIAKSPTSLDLFITGNDGRVYTSWWYEGSDWSGINDNWRSVGGFFPPGAPVAATSRNAGNLDLFITGNDGRVYTCWWYAGSDWSGINDNWRGIGGFFPPGAPVTAIAKSPTSLDLFITGNDGRVYTSWWYEGSDWSGINDNWRGIGGFFPAGIPVAGIARTPSNLDLFIVGNDHRVYTSWWSAGSEWSGINDNWRVLAHEDRPPANQLDFDFPSITFDSGVPVGGFAHLTLFNDGTYKFSGHFHDSGGTEYNVAAVVAVKDSANLVYTFQHQGHVSGTFEPGSRDDDWSNDGQNQELAKNWPNLAAGATGRLDASARLDMVNLTNSLIGTLGTVLGIIAIIIA